MDDYTSWPSEGLLWRHIGLVIHDRFFKQLLFGVLLAAGKLAPLTACDRLSEQYDFFYTYYISLIDIDSIVFMLHKGASLPIAGSIPKRSCLKNLSWMTYTG